MKIGDSFTLETVDNFGGDLSDYLFTIPKIVGREKYYVRSEETRNCMTGGRSFEDCDEADDTQLFDFTMLTEYRGGQLVSSEGKFFKIKRTTVFDDSPF